MSPILLLAAAGLATFLCLTFGQIIPLAAPAPVDVDGMPGHPDDDVDDIDPPADGSTIDQWDRPDRAPGVHIRRRLPAEDAL